MSTEKISIPTIRDASLNVELIVTLSTYAFTLTLFFALVCTKHVLLAFIVTPIIFVALVISKMQIHDTLYRANPRSFALRALMFQRGCRGYIQEFNLDGAMRIEKDDGMLELVIERDDFELARLYIDKRSALVTAAAFRRNGSELFHSLRNHSVAFAYDVETGDKELPRIYIDTTALCLLVRSIELNTEMSDADCVVEMLRYCSGKYARALTVEPSTYIDIVSE